MQLTTPMLREDIDMIEKQKILIVDDRKENRVALREVLRDIDADIVEAESGNEALVATLDQHFAVAILDVMMPGMSGYELAEHLRGDEKTKVIPIVFLTASYADEQHMFEGYEAGGIDYLIKPFAPEVLLGKVKVFLELDQHKQELKLHRDHLERLVAEQTRKLQDRVSEINCLYSISSLFAKPIKSIDEVMKSAVELFPPDLRHTGTARARIVFEGREFAAEGFRETDWKQSADIAIAGVAVGTVEVCCLEERPALGEERFIHQGERELINEIARQLAVMIQQKRAEEALRNSERKYRMLTENLPQKIFIKDRQSVYVSCNDNYARGLGIVPEEIAGRTDYDFYPREVAEKHRFEDERLIEQGTAKESEERYIQNGKETWVHMVSTPVRDDDGKVTGVLGIFWDVTERRQLEEQFRQAQRLESIGRLAGGVAHDFNNMLSVIMGYGEELLQQLPVADRLRESVAEIVEAGKRSAALTRQLLAFSRKQTLQPEVLDLNGIVKNLENMLQRLIGEDIRLVTRLADDLARVEADPGQIEQVIMNLAVNARDAMPRGGKLIIETANVELDEAYANHHVSVAPGKYVSLTLTDTGSGMDEATTRKIFEPFFTTKEKGKGTGLGLSTVYGIVKQSGGNVWVYSEPGIGTTFKIYMPQTNAEPARKETPTPRGEVSFADVTVLAVEDDPAVRRLLERMLTRLRCQVTVAANGIEALRLIEENGLRPDLLITDVVMPEMSGVVLVERLRAIQPDIKILFMSGYTDTAIVHHGALDPNTPFIQKPYSFRDLTSKIESLLRG